MNYALDIAKKQIVDLLKSKDIHDDIDIETPPENVKADFAVPLYKIAAKRRVNPQIIAEEIKEKIDLKNSMFLKVERSGAYLNFYLDTRKYNQSVLENIKKMGSDYGKSKDGKGKNIIIDYSSPNIAKPFSIGHLRSTVIGQALSNIYKFLGYKVIGDNHLGDWGTQFGKLLLAYDKWGSEKKLKKDPMKESLKLYVKFHEESKLDKKIEDEARGWFKKLEDGDKKAIKLWQLFKDLSLADFKRIYNMLEVKFDTEFGESFYQDKTKAIIKKCIKTKLAKWEIALEDDGKPNKKGEKVLVINLKKYGIEAPLLLQKSDGTTLYATRDLAAIDYRIKKYKPEEILYVVGSEQKLYFRQLFKVAELLGYKSKLTHVDFGLIRIKDGKMSTREGKVILLEDVLSEAIKKVNDIINVRKLNNKEKETISKIVGIGAIKYADLSQNRIHDIVFDWNKILDLKGNSGPYLQYQIVRINSILEKTGGKSVNDIDPKLLNDEIEIKLIKDIAKYPEVVENAKINNQPYVLADYLYNLSQKFSHYYENIPVLKAKNSNLKNARLFLCKSLSNVLASGLEILGIEFPEKM